MANNNLDPADRTPLEVLSAIAENTKAYPSDGCIPCGAVVHIGFFFDGFARHRDFDDPQTSRYSNICRLWEAHRDNRDTRRVKTPNQFWYPLYYSGLGTELNKEAKDGQITSAILGKVAGAVDGAIKSAPSKMEKVAEKVAGVDRLKVDPKSAITDGFKKGIEEHSYRPVVDAYKALVKQAKAAPSNAGRVLRIFRDGRFFDRTETAIRIITRNVKKTPRAIVYDFKESPFKTGWAVAREIFKCSFDVVPIVRDNRAVARLLGTGVEPRLVAAKKQFKAAIEDARAKIPKIQRIQVSVFGADRGCVLARALLNELTETYKHPSKAILEYKIPGDPNDNTVPIEIVFVGLLDAVSSVMEDNQVISILPLVGMIKQNYGDQTLAVPESVQRCVHFAAAHELRFYQRLDSLEKTRGVQYLYPGTSEDVTGGSPQGELGMRAELQRVVLRDMLHEALIHGVVVDSMEDLQVSKRDTFEKFTLAHPISDGQSTFKIREMFDAYRQMVPYVARLNFVEHMQIFLRWMATRYTSAEFRETVTKQFDERDIDHKKILSERNDAQATYDALRNQWPPVDLRVLADAQTRVDDLSTLERESTRLTSLQKSHPSVGVWDRIKTESEQMLKQLAKRDAYQVRMRASADKIRTQVPSGEQPYDADPEYSASLIDGFSDSMLTDDQAKLVQAWKMGLEGKNPLPPKVMALFDLLVHDTMLTSWHDHVLASTLYFQTRGVDTFGSSDYVEEEKQRKTDEQSASNAAQARRRPSAGLDIRPGAAS